MSSIVIKIGSSSLISDRSINKTHLEHLAQVTKTFLEQGHQVLIVTSGAIAMGMGRLGLTKKPKEISLKQACAAIGQAALMQAYEQVFSEHDIKVAQILLSHEDFDVRKRMVHLHNTLEALAHHQVVPIINENDALAVEEIKVGDNDTLSSLIASIERAKILFLISDIDGLYDKNPQLYHDAKRIPVVESINRSIMAMAKDSLSDVGTGGMRTKLKAAKIATTSGVMMVICHIEDLSRITDLDRLSEFATVFMPCTMLKAKSHWLLYHSTPRGDLVLDPGASQAILDRKSLLPQGIRGVEGEFLQGSVINLKNEQGTILARGISYYNSEEIRMIKGLSPTKIQSLYPQHHKKEIVHANNMMMIEGEDE
jgi:glutamate 5-kinase